MLADQTYCRFASSKKTRLGRWRWVEFMMLVVVCRAWQWCWWGDGGLVLVEPPLLLHQPVRPTKCSAVPSQRSRHQDQHHYGCLQPHTSHLQSNFLRAPNIPSIPPNVLQYLVLLSAMVSHWPISHQWEITFNVETGFEAPRQLHQKNNIHNPCHHQQHQELNVNTKITNS